MASDAVNPRPGHPYWMYEALRSQPDAVRRLLDEGWRQAREAAWHLRECRRLFLVGIGSSYHVAVAGEYWLRLLTGVDAHAVMSLEAVHYPPKWEPADGIIAISHRGGFGYTRGALEKALTAGMPTVAVSGMGADLPPDVPFLETCPLETSNCHTVGYSSALVAMAQLATALAEVHDLAIPPEWEARLATISEDLRAQLETEATMREWARAVPPGATVVVVGAGPHQATAAELALKIQEAASRPVLAMTVEQLAHGPMASLQAGDLVVSTLPAGALAEARLIQVARGLQALGVPLWALYPGEDVPAARRLGQREEPEWFAPLTGLVPLQLLTYHLALQAGLDPDWNRLEAPAHARAKAHY